MTHKLVALTLCLTLLLPSLGWSKGSFSSGGSRPSASSSSRSYGGGSSYSRPSYSGSRSYRTTTTRTITRNYYGGGGGYYYHPYMAYPGFGMGYGYSNGLVEGLIIGSLMHPAGTVAYTYGGYSGPALLYPDGRVVDQNGYQVGTYVNGQFTAVQNGALIAQPAPQNPGQLPQQVQVIDGGQSSIEDLVTGLAVVFALFFVACMVAAVL